MTPTVCLEPGCPAFAVSRGRCAEHQVTGEGDTSWGKRRDRATQARFRRAVLEHAGNQCQAIVDGVRCDVTGAENLEAHHLVVGNDDPSTGRALCKPPPHGRGHHRAVDPHAR